MENLEKPTVNANGSHENVAYKKSVLKSTYFQCFTFIDCWKAFAQPATAASEFNPQSTVGWDDWIWKHVSTKTACQSAWKNNTSRCLDTASS